MLQLHKIARYTNVLETSAVNVKMYIDTSYTCAREYTTVLSSLFLQLAFAKIIRKDTPQLVKARCGVFFLSSK